MVFSLRDSFFFQVSLATGVRGLANYTTSWLVRLRSGTLWHDLCCAVFCFFVFQFVRVPRSIRHDKTALSICIGLLVAVTAGVGE